MIEIPQFAAEAVETAQSYECQNDSLNCPPGMKQNTCNKDDYACARRNGDSRSRKARFRSQASTYCTAFAHDGFAPQRLSSAAPNERSE
tara:strand:- start:217 stop:483 length:267 start_codon:yes stop_codon:yes gene_type:complete